MNHLNILKNWPCSLVLTTLAFTNMSWAQLAENIDFAELTDSELSPEVRNVLETPGERSQLGLDYIRYAEALLAGGNALDEMVNVDVQLHDLEPIGFKGLAGLKEFRFQRNAAFSYDRSVITAMRFPENEVIEADVCTERTDTSSGAKRVIVIHARTRWVEHMLLERWDSLEELPAGSDCGPPTAP